MKFVKALNSGIVSDLGLGSHIYNISLEGCEVPDDIAVKIKSIYGDLVEVSDSAPVVEAPAVTPEPPVEEKPKKSKKEEKVEEPEVPAEPEEVKE